MAKKKQASGNSEARALRRAARIAGRRNNDEIDPDNVFAAVFDDMTKESVGRGLVKAQYTRQLVCGLAMPSLALRILIGQDMLPLSRAVMLAGEPRTYKSTFLMEMSRWVACHKGLAVHIDPEGKDSPSMREAILEHDPALIRRVQPHSVDTQNDWMEAAVSWILKADARFAKIFMPLVTRRKRDELAEDYKARVGPRVNKKAPGWIYPMLVGVDSLMATGTAEVIDAILKEGPTRRYADEARNLTDWALTLTYLLRTRPVVLVATNHLKPRKQDNGVTEDHTPGGFSMKFKDSLEIKMLRGKPLREARREGQQVTFVVTKNSLAPTNGRITANLWWWWAQDPNTGKVQQYARWDWDAAAIGAILAIKTQPASAERWKAVQAVVDLRVPETGPKLIWSRALGIPASQPVTFTEAGQALEARPDLLEALYPVLPIDRHAQFIPGTDYSDIQARLLRSTERLDTIYRPAAAPVPVPLPAEAPEPVAAAEESSDDTDSI